MLDLFSKKVLQIEVTRGVDLEAKTYLIGDRVTVGTGPNDGLRLGTPDIVPGHLTFERTPKGAWEYFSSDRGGTAVKSGNPRTGNAKPGMWFDLGLETRIEIRKVTAPPDLLSDKDEDTKTEVPLTIALPAMGLMAVAAAMVMSSGSRGDVDTGLATANWFAGHEDLAPALDICLASGLSPEAAKNATDPLSPDAAFRAYHTQMLAGQQTDAIFATLLGDVRALIGESHLLAQENKASAASDVLRRLEYVLPVGNGDCPILSAARYDLAVFAVRGQQEQN